MNLLAAETATGHCSVALWKDGATFLYKSEGTFHQQAEHLLPLMERILSEQKLSYSNLDALAVCTGPGSFTGVRIGLAALQGITLAIGKPLIGVSSLEAICWMAHKQHNRKTIFVTLDAGRGEYYTQHFTLENDTPKPLTEAMLAEHASLLKQMKDPALTFVSAITPNAEAIAELAAIHFKAGRAGKKPAIPLYIRQPDARKRIQ